MKMNAIEEIVDDIRQGKMVILMDDEDRENEGDLIIAAERVRTEDINFMATNARGLICLTLTRERCDYLNLPLMVNDNNTTFNTSFTVSIEAATGVTTGISAADRARTIQVAVARSSSPEDIIQPGHIFPIMAQPGGVLRRAGHTESGCDLARMAGYLPAAAIVEIMNEDGSMARRPDLEKFADKHELKIGTIVDLIHYRIANEHTVTESKRIWCEPVTESSKSAAIRIRSVAVCTWHLPWAPSPPTNRPWCVYIYRIRFETCVKYSMKSTPVGHSAALWRESAAKARAWLCYYLATIMGRIWRIA